MVDAAQNAFEIERRAILWTPLITLNDDVTALGYDEDPNNVVPGNSDGEDWLLILPIGQFYKQSNANLWWKVSKTPNIWALMGGTMPQVLIDIEHNILYGLQGGNPSNDEFYHLDSSSINDLHSHNNKDILDLFDEDSSGLTYNGLPIGGGVSVDGHEPDRIVSPDGDNLIITDDSLTYNDGTSNRLDIGAVNSRLMSPDQITNVTVNDTGAYYNGGEILTEYDKGVANGVAELDAGGIVPTSQLPAYVDEIVEYEDLFSLEHNDPQEGNKIYITIDTGKMYRFTGTPGSYGEISPTIVLGTTNTTAYRGDRGLIAYDHSQTPHDYSASDHEHDRIVSADGDSLIITDTTLKYNDGAIDRLDIVSNGTAFYSPNGDKYLKIANAKTFIHDGNSTRFLINTTESKLRSPDTINYLTVDDTGAYYNTGEILTELDKGVANGVAELDANMIVPLVQLPEVYDSLTFSENINLGITGAFYIGDETTDGSWRFRIVGNDLDFEKRISGEWILRGGFTG